MSVKLRILSILSALCFLGSIACFSGYASEVIDRASKDEKQADDPGYVDPGYDPGYVDPSPGYDPGNVDSVQPYDPGYVDPSAGGEVSVDPGYVDPSPGGETSVDPGYVDPSAGGETSVDPGNDDPTQSYTPSPSDLISEGNYPQPDPSSGGYDNNESQYNQYIANTNNAQYDDNYLYVPSYTAPAESLIETSSKVIDTDELTADDWASIMLDLDNGSVSNDGTKTFNFIKNNEDEGDTSIEWMLYLGVALILLSVFTDRKSVV